MIIFFRFSLYLFKCDRTTTQGLQTFIILALQVLIAYCVDTSFIHLCIQNKQLDLGQMNLILK